MQEKLKIFIELYINVKMVIEMLNGFMTLTFVLQYAVASRISHRIITTALIYCMKEAVIN